MTKIAGSGSASGSIRQRLGSADPDPDPDSHQNVMDPQHCGEERFSIILRIELLNNQGDNTFSI
jgi:hypothetical protein